MITEIGIVAGEIWHFLDDHENVTLDELVKGINKPHELVLMSLGWLAREGHVSVMWEDDQYRINFRSKKRGAI